MARHRPADAKRPPSPRDGGPDKYRRESAHRDPAGVSVRLLGKRERKHALVVAGFRAIAINIARQGEGTVCPAPRAFDNELLFILLLLFASRLGVDRHAISFHGYLDV